MPMGFIQSELDLKLLVLYIMSRVAGPVTFLQLLELALCDEGVDYFSLTEAVGHMVETGQLERDQEQRYSITEKGRRNSAVCESSLAFSVRKKCDRNLAKVNAVLRRNAQVRSELLPREDGGVTLRLILDDDKGNLMTLDLLAVSEDQANQLADQFRLHPEALYENILQTLLGEPPL